MGKTGLEVSLIHPIDIEPIWMDCVEHIGKPIELSCTDISIDTVKAALLSGEAFMIIVKDGTEIIAANVLHTIVYPTGHRVLSLPIIGGSRMVEWMDDFSKMTHSLARTLGCKELRGFSQRKGWLKFLNDHDQPWYGIHELIGCKVATSED